jgi:lactam utilization protein B
MVQQLQVISVDHETISLKADTLCLHGDGAHAVDFAQKIKNRLPADIQLHSLKLQETETSFAEWYASDNL